MIESSKTSRYVGVIVGVLALIIIATLTGLGAKSGAMIQNVIGSKGGVIIQNVIVYLGGAMFAMIANGLIMGMAITIYSRNIDKKDYPMFNQTSMNRAKFIAISMSTAMIIVTLAMYVPKVITGLFRILTVLFITTIHIPLIGYIIIACAGLLLLAVIIHTMSSRNALLSTYAGAFMYLQITQSMWAFVVMNMFGSRVIMILGSASVTVFTINLSVSIVVGIIVWNYFYFFDNSAYIKWTGLTYKVFAKIICQKYPTSQAAIAFMTIMHLKSEEYWCNNATCKALLKHFLENNQDLQLSGFNSSREEEIEKFETTGQVPCNFSVFMQILNYNHPYWKTLEDLDILKQKPKKDKTK